MNTATQKFHVYKSSAGSGKTTALSIAYLKLALSQKYAFKHIIALTFTNKAAQEMKERILKYLVELSKISEDNKPFFVEELFNDLPQYQENGKIRMDAVERLKADAKELHRNLLHHYSEYSVTTIDSFTNRLIRTFSYDLGLSFNYQVEMNSQQLLEDVVNELVNRIGGQEDQITKVLLHYSRQKIDNQNSRKINKDLEQGARSLLNDVEEQYLKPLRKMDIDIVFGIRGKVIASIKKFENTLIIFGQSFLDLCDRNSIEQKMFSNARSSVYAYFQRFVKEDFSKIEPVKTILKMVETQQWTTKNAKQSIKDLFELISEELSRIFYDSQEFMERKYSDYLLMKEIEKSIFPFMVLMELEKILNQMKEENQLIHISDFNKIISEEIAGESAPYIYERIGTKYEHFLLDEFQDTSVMQWHNLLPLVENSLSENHYNLIVGDAKQAIYRWRGSDVRQFSQLPYLQYEADDELSLQRENMLKNAYLGLNLDTNYRSGKTIVEFNNTLFQFVSSNWIPESQKEVYKGFVQKVKNKDKASSVDIYLLEKPKESRKKEDYTALYLDKTKEIILHCKSQGFAYKEMAVLARNNKILNALAEFLISEDIPVVSSESLFVASSPTVQFILSLLRYVSYPKEGIYQSEIIKYLLDNEKIYGADMHQLSAFLLENRAEEELQYLWASLEVQLDIKTLQSLDAYELVEFLTQTFTLNKTDPLLHFFMEAAFVYTQSQNKVSANFLEWWEVNHSDYKLDVPEEFDAVKLMSFHKAKGLEFPVVINWFSQSQMAKPKNLPTMIWVNPQLATVPELKSFPFNVNKLKGTQLEEKYTQEIDLDHLDMLNLFYVANTRPTEKLFLLVDQYEAPKPSSKPKVSSDFRFDKMMHDFVLEAKLEIQEEGNYHFGEEISHRNDNGSEKQMGEALDIEICASESWKKNIAFSIDNSQEQLWAHAVEWGIKVHAILSEISTIDDVEKLKHHWVIKYHLNKEDLQWITQILYQIVEHPLLKPYYQAGVEVYNEKDIFGPKNGKKGVQRVDRMAITQDYCAIIDYKTGAPNQKDQQQVKDYKNIVSQIIPQKVKGFLVYLYEEIVVEDV